MSEIVEQDFSKGMVTDFSNPPPDTFLEAVNFELISDEHNTFAFESVKGNKVIVQVTKNYRPHGFAKGTDKLILYSAYVGTLSQNNGEVAILTFPEVLPGLSVNYQPVYNHRDLNFRPDKPIGKEAFVYPENPKTEPSYWSDFNTPPKTLNHADPIFNTNIVSGSLVFGKSYMVLDPRTNGDPIPAAVNYNGILYGPNEVAGTVFVANSGNTYANNGHNTIVIEYFPVELLDWVPAFKLGNIRFKRWLVGTLLCGNYQYLYQVADNNGFYGKWSMPSRVVHVATPTLPGPNFSDYQNLQGHDSTTVSDIGNRLTIDQIDTIYTRIRVAAVFYNAFQVSQQPVLIFDGPITGATMDIDHLSNKALQQLNFTDIEQIVVNLKKVNTLATVNEINFPANVETEADFDWDPSVGIVAKNIPYDVATDYVPCNPTASNSLNGTERAEGTGISNTNIRSEQWYRVMSSNIGAIVNYNGTNYGPTQVAGNVFKGVAGVYTYTDITPGPQHVEAIIRVRKYGPSLPIFSPDPACLDVQIYDDYYDSKGQGVDHYLKSYWRTEQYRYGILLFGISGNPFYVRWLADKTVPAMNKLSADIDPDTGAAIGFDMGLGHFSNDPGTDWTTHDREYLLRHIGIQFDQIDFAKLVSNMGITLTDLPSRFSGFAIVRCPRDRQVITQGLLFPTILNRSQSVIRPQAPNEMFLDFNADSGSPNQQANLYCLYSPDSMMKSEQMPLIASGDLLEIEDYFFDDFSPPIPTYRYSISGSNITPGPSWYFYNKLYKRKVGAPVNATSYGRRNPIDTKWSRGIETGETGVTIFTNYNFDNKAVINTFMFGQNMNCAGARTLLLATTLSEHTGGDCNYGFGSYVDGSGNYGYTTEKAIVNYLRPKANLYGGTGAAAKAVNQYITTGHYQAFDSDFITYLTGNGGKADGIQVFGGDAFVNIVDISRMIPNDVDTNYSSGDFSSGITDIWPCEQNLNVALREGRHESRNRAIINFGSTPEQYICNSAYSSEESNIAYPALPDNYKPNNIFSYRAYYSDKKIPGELRNSFRVFQPGNYKDVDGQRGSITNVRTKAMRLFYWQQSGMGYIPINERASIPSQVVGAPLIIGEGGVAQRFDERTNFYGNQHKHGLAEFEDGFVWMDLARRSYCMMSMDGQPYELSVIKGLLTDFHDLPKNNNDAVGIWSQYDPRFKRILTTFNLVNSRNDGFPLTIFNKTLIFDTLNKQFAGWFIPNSELVSPMLSFWFNEKYYSTGPALAPQVILGASYGIGSVKSSPTATNDNFVCYLAINNTGDPATDPIHWKRVNSVDEIYLHYVNDIGKFYNLVADGKVKYAVTGKELQNLEKIFDNHRWRASENFFTSLKASADGNILGTDVNLETHPDYQYRNKAWYASVPLDNSTGEQVQDYKMIVELIQNNQLLPGGDPTVSSNKRIVLNSVQTFFRKAY